MSNIHGLTPAQRRAKNDRDRRRRREHGMEFKRLKRVEVEWGDEIRHLREENERLNQENKNLDEILSNSNILGQLSGLKQGLHGHHQALEEYIKLLESYLLGKSPSPNEELANNEHITHCPGSSQSDIQYADELVEDFIKKLDAKEKSKVDFSDFDGLKEEMETSGINSLPPSLAPFDTIIKENCGEIDADSTQSSCTAMPSRILFCAAIREMSNLQLENIDEKKILLWRDAINSALNINFKVEFAITHLKKIAHAYFGLKAWNEPLNDPELMSITKRISELKTEYHALEARK